MNQRRQAVSPQLQQPINPSIDKSIYQLTRHVGIQTTYVDTAGRRQEASPETIVAILELWGISARNKKQIRDAIAECERSRWRKIVEPVIVAWGGREAKIELHIPAAAENEFAEFRLRPESEPRKIFSLRLKNLRTLKRRRVSGINRVVKELTIPTLPYGYHQLEIELAGVSATALLISAPTKSYLNSGLQKSWGAFLPMYAAHSNQSWGAGNFGDWQKLTEWVASLGGRFVSTLPLLSAFLERPVCEPSPYSPASRLFWNEFYLDIPAIPEFSRCAAAQKLVRARSFQTQLERFRSNSLTNYPAEMAARRQVLEQLAHFFFKTSSTRRTEFKHFLSEQPRVEDYAKFRACCDDTNLPWEKWPRRMRDGNLRTDDCTEVAKNYHLYVQWVAHEQITTLTENCRARRVQFYLDLPLGVHPAGYDLWRERDAFAFGATAGAPPDAFFSNGQNWGFAPLHPQRLRDQGYRYLRDVLEFQMRHTGMLRLDHVMSLHRLYWIPKGFTAKEGAYVSNRPEEMYAILCLESHRHKTVIVGENLGTVPDEVNKAMNRHGLRRMYVVQFSQRPHSRGALAKPPPHSVASLNTHDMPTFAAHWRGLDIEDRTKLGLLSEAEAQEEHARRVQLNLALAKFLVHTSKAAVEQVIRACFAWLRASSADLVLLNLEDLWEEEYPQNVPGTSTERPNWRRKARFTIEQIRRDAELRKTLHGLQKCRRTSYTT